jgi:predicted CoA-binding protein
MKATKASIEAFLAAPEIAVAGVSRDPKKFGHQVFKLLKEQGKKVLPVNPGATEIDGTQAYKNVGDLPREINHLVILTPKKQTREILENAIEKGISNIWIQQMSETPEALAYAQSKAVDVISGECIFLHAKPVKGIHKFHRAIRSFFGRMPV